MGLRCRSIVQLLGRQIVVSNPDSSHSGGKPFGFGLHMGSVDVFHGRAASQRHGQLKLVPKHLQNLLYSILPFTSKPEDNGPPNLQHRSFVRSAECGEFTTTTTNFFANLFAAELQTQCRMKVQEIDIASLWSFIEI